MDVFFHFFRPLWDFGTIDLHLCWSFWLYTLKKSHQKTWKTWMVLIQDIKCLSCKVPSWSACFFSMSRMRVQVGSWKSIQVPGKPSNVFFCWSNISEGFCEFIILTRSLTFFDSWVMGVYGCIVVNNPLGRPYFLGRVPFKFPWLRESILRDH